MPKICSLEKRWAPLIKKFQLNTSQDPVFNCKAIILPMARCATVCHSSLKHSFPVETHWSRQNFCQKAFLSFGMQCKGRGGERQGCVSKKSVAGATLLEIKALVLDFGVTWTEQGCVWPSSSCLLVIVLSTGLLANEWVITESPFTFIYLFIFKFVRVIDDFLIEDRSIFYL